MTLPTAFGRYQLLERLAAGGMAEVFLARSFGAEGFEKRLVIKRILPELANQPRFVQLFIHEAKLSVALNHPNVVTVFDLGKVGNEPYIAMEHIHGRDLAQVLRVLRREGQRMPEELAASVAASVARGLAYAHARNAPDGRPLHIVHRDVSPHNVVMSFEGAVKLVDFGIARLEGETGAAHPGGGKFAYMSPEQAAGANVDARADIFSLGVVLFEMLAGKRLFAEGEAEEKRQAVLRCELPAMEDALPDAPDALRDVLRKSLQRDPEARYADAEAMEEDLRAWLFSRGWRGELHARAAWLQALFPGEAERRSGLELERLAEDLQALQAAPAAEGTHAGTQAPGSDEASDVALTHEATRYATHPVLERGERRAVAVLVVEVNGLTDLSARVEHEDIARLHYRMLRAMRGVIDRLGGVADRFEEDTLTVLFGVPRATGEDVDRALACARELHRLAGRMRRRGVVVELAAGVHVGELSAAPAGRKTRWTARGDTRKTAVRLAYLAEPGTTLASDRVAALSGDRFPFDRGPDLRGKGPRGVRPTFILAGGPRESTRNGITGRWFRRGDEVETLRGAIGALREGRGSRIALLGDAGVGKSRLFRELRDLARRRGVPVFQGRAAAWSAEAPLAPFRDLLADVLGVSADARPTQVRERLGRLSAIGLEPAEVAALASLLAVATGDAASEGRGREPAHDALLAATSRLLRGFAADGPVVLLLEDLHYLEPSEVDLLSLILRAVVGLRVLVLGSWRGDVPERLAPFFQTVCLRPLTRVQTEGYAADLLDATAVGPELAALLARTSEGNPLYVEETVKALREAGRVYHEGTVARLSDPLRDPGLPATLQGLIAARLDRLDTAARGALQVAAVIGPSFSPMLLGAAVGAPEPHALVTELVRAGLVTPEARAPDTPYAFASVLVWECTLRSILGIQRRAYHRLIAGAIERVYADRREAFLETFAAHAHAGGRTRDAARSLLDAACAQRRAQLLERALDICERARAWLRTAPREESDLPLEAALDVEAGELALLLGRPRAEQLLQAALEAEGSASVEGRALLGLGTYYLEQGKLPLARAHLEAAASGFRRLGDRHAQVRTCEQLGALALEERKPELAQAVWEEGLRLAGEDAEPAARMLLGMASHALRKGDNDQAAVLLARALPHAERANDRILMGRVLNNLGVVQVHDGQFERAIQHFRRALEAREGLGYRHGDVINHHNIGDVLFRLGDLPRAWACFEHSRELARACDWERGVTMNDAYLQYLRGLRGEDCALELQDTCARAGRAGDRETALLAEAFSARLQGSERRFQHAVAEARSAGYVDLARQLETGLARAEQAAQRTMLRPP